MPWYTYIVHCADNTLYTGVTTDLEKRVQKHNNGTAAKYTAGRAPISLMWFEEQPNESAAKKREAEIKKLTRKKKLKICHSEPCEESPLRSPLS